MFALLHSNRFKLKSFQILDIIRSKRLDVLVVVKTWYTRDMQDTILRKAVPDDLSVIHSFHNDRRGGRISVIFMSHLRSVTCPHVRLTKDQYSDCHLMQQE